MRTLRVHHSLPERVRFSMPAVRDKATALRLEKNAKDIDGIHWARANVRCGGVVVRYDGTRFSESEVVQLVANQNS